MPTEGRLFKIEINKMLLSPQGLTLNAMIEIHE